MSLPLIPVVLCGGSGTRLWPLSRDTYPKQFLPLLGEETLLQQTMQRLRKIDGMGAPLLVCNESSRFIAAEQLREIGITDANILLEPMRRNTAPAIAVAALQAMAHGDDPILMVLPSDHVIKNQATFSAAVNIAKQAAEEGKLVTFGISPLGPETGYGYIRAGTASAGQAQPVLEFVEKPDRATAEKYLASGNYFWNSGMFVFRASRYLEELSRFHPEIVAACQNALALAKNDLDFIRLDSASYIASPDKAIDYAVMERTEYACVVPLDAGWSDIGSWTAVWEAAAKNADNNATHGDVILQDCDNCLVHGTTRLVSAIGLRDIVIVETADAVLVMHKDHAQNIKQLVEKLSTTQRPEVLQHREVARPWGSYDSIGKGPRFQVKRITVKPGAKLSLQMHHHRAEHWVVATGTARITNGEQVYLLTENQSTYIPVGVVHSLENPGKIPLELIEIQSGTYLGEDDIVRLEDRYGRT
ncbi:mannose-1-phosphate guanylyltransferase/mannose-6-phosphate isomerase [Glaciimonas immobilis]|uniref:mannose-1-phosphate guanylyltransferase n=1 Tax=Glaciimonas immobilis TaxID=728004 RepID=A0A840RPQ2_9BURK|nr:mannose-1-phosphate guanylyltransferase/mannose-6-phosphate isomerase [Glaciimonas immobilis]KAF3998168.1 mannose-1-phosphate guanylyltransferase/mannose-6-phosphate isomerase [Glaciimonas immobilis]MBB5199122.1 mannose-1-phosphate guanylyltransferase/mannose-6-phosphate isomerase [Glaciimonas immobilis]